MAEVEPRGYLLSTLAIDLIYDKCADYQIVDVIPIHIAGPADRGAGGIIGTVRRGHCLSPFAPAAARILPARYSRHRG